MSYTGVDVQGLLQLAAVLIFLGLAILGFEKRGGWQGPVA
jgi:hypothetical protein